MVIALAIVLLAACGESVATTAVELPEASTSAVDPTTKELQELTAAYWDAFNAYDADLVLSYLEESYRVTRDAPIRAEINSISAFGIQLRVQDEGPPVVLDDGKAEMFIELREPLGTRRIRIAFEQIAGEWVITFAEEVD